MIFISLKSYIIWCIFWQTVYYCKVQNRPFG
nr:MAG TPA: hypothetical protein [Caudoviricetes sp.]